MNVPEDQIPARWKDPLPILDLYGLSDEDLRQRGKMGIFLLAMKYIYDPDILYKLREVVPELQKIDATQSGSEFLVSLFSYLFEASLVKNKDKLEQFAVESLSEETGGEIVSIAEQLREEGRKEMQERVELAEKRERESKIQMVKRMLEESADLDFIARVAQMPIERVIMIRDNL